MARAFISSFLLPLVRGGGLQVGRPLFPDDVERLMRAHAVGRVPDEQAAADALRFARRRALLSVVSNPPTPELDAETWRLGAAIHNLLALEHPRIGTGPGADSRLERVSAAATALARVGAPPTQARALNRHSMVARLSEVAREDHTVRFWLGRRTFVGRAPPPRMLALPRLRSVQVESVRRVWLRDIGVAAVARPAFLALMEASPLGEACDPLRLDPPWSWARALSVLRFPTLCRVVAGRLVAAGVSRTGDALAEALYRFVSLEEGDNPLASSPEAAAFALAFLSHLTWLGVLFDAAPRREAASLPLPLPSPLPVASRSPTSAVPSPSLVGEGGRELAVMLAAALQVQRALIWPGDVPTDSPLGLAFSHRLERLFARHDVTRSPRWPAALYVAQRAAFAASTSEGAHAV